MHRRAVIALALAALAGCTRDLEVPPKPSIAPLGVIPAFQSVAPRQPVQFAGAGGVAPYTFAFAQGGQLSGADATLTASGAYQAGSSGAAQDVIEVTDARGVVAAATVSVGQRIAVTPAFTGTVPGGRITFQASGGGATHDFTTGTSGSGGGVTLDGLYTAGSVGDTVDTVLVTDGYGAFAKAEIHVGSQLQLYRAEARPVAPRESVTIIALGGQPPYRYSVDLPGAYDPAVDATILANGAYTAGSRANDPDPYAPRTDTVRVVDSADVPQSAALTVQVGPALRLALDTAELYPGRPAQLVATGGKPPYAFAFAARTLPAADPGRTRGGNGGNRSHGTVNALTGEYVPGFSPGAVDWFQVTDATAAPAAVLEGPRVGSLPLAIGSGVRGCATGDLNGDGSEDVVLSMSGDSSSKAVTGMLLDTTEPWLQSYFLQTRAATTYVDDFARTGRRSVAVVGGDTRCPNDGTFCPAPDFWALAPDLVGYLSAQPLAGGGPEQAVKVWNAPEFQYGIGTLWHYETTNWNVRQGTGRYDAASATWQFWGQGWDADTLQTAWSPGPQRCWDGAWSYETDAWLMRMDWKVGDRSPSRPACVKAKGFCPTCAGGAHHRAIAMGAGDLDGDGRVDLAWILDTDGNRLAEGTQGAKLYLARGLADGSFGAITSGWPAGGPWSFEIADGGTDQPRFQVVRPPGAARDALLVRLVDTSRRRGQLFLLRDPAAAWSAPQDPNRAGAGVDGFVSGAGGAFYAWSGDDGVVTGFALDPSLALTAAGRAATLPFAVNSVCLPDVNADGIPDLVAASDLGATAQLVLGDGGEGAATAGTFGELVHQRGLAFPIVTGDLDGDGFLDAVVANGSGAGIAVLWGGGGQLAWGAQLSSISISAATAGRYLSDTDARPSIFYQEKSGRFGILHNRGDGTFDPAVALTGVTSAGGPAEASFFAWPADLNTADPGLDALTFGQKGSGGMTPRALLVQQRSGRVVDVAASIPQLDAIRARAQDCWTLAVGDRARLQAGTAAIVMGCTHSNQNETSNAFAIWGTTLRNVDHPPAEDGTQPAFGDWVLLTSTTVSPDPAYSAPVAGGGRLRSAMVGTLDVGSGVADTAVFLFATDRLYAVEVSTEGQPNDPAAWIATRKAIAPDVTGFYPFLAAAGRLDAASAFHVVAGGGKPEGGVGGGGALVIARAPGASGGYTRVQQVGSSGFPVGIGRLAAGSPGDAVFFVGDWGNTGLVPEVTIRLNDGTGRFR